MVTGDRGGDWGQSNPELAADSNDELVTSAFLVYSCCCSRYCRGKGFIC